MVRQYKALLTAVPVLLLVVTPQLARNCPPKGGTPNYDHPTAVGSIRESDGDPWAASAQVPIPTVKRDLLLNELQLIVLPQLGTGTVMVHLRVNSGAMFDLAGKGGLADLTAGMLLRSAKGFAAKDLSEFVTQQGLTLNIKVGWDSTDITISGPAALLESILDLLGLLVINPNFGQTEFDSLKASRIKELSAEAPALMELARESAIETLYGRYPLGRPVHGTADSISKITRNDIIYYHNRFYLANDSELAVVGDATPEEVTKFARSKLGIWKKGEKVPATFLPPEPLGSRKIVVVDRPDSTDAGLVLAGHGISRRSKDYLATAVMARVLESLITQATSGTGSGVNARLEARYLAGPLIVALNCRPEKAPTALQAALDAMERMKSGDVPAEEIERAKQSVISSYVQDTTNVDGQISALFDIEQYGLGRDYMLNFEARVAAVGTDEVKSAAQNHLNPAAVAVSVVGPGATLSDGLKKFGKVSVVGGRQNF